MKIARRMRDISAFRVMEILARARAMEAGGRDVVHMEIGEPDFASPEPVIAAAAAACKAGYTHYTPAAGLASLIMILAGGFRYLTAGDNPKNVEQAGKTLTSAVVGLIVVISAWLILTAIEAITGINVTFFRFPRPES